MGVGDQMPNAGTINPDASGQQQDGWPSKAAHIADDNLLRLFFILDHGSNSAVLAPDIKTHQRVTRLRQRSIAIGDTLKPVSLIARDRPIPAGKQW